jgi:molybdate transport system regulatory protein
MVKDKKIKFSVDGRVWINSEVESFLGQGRLELIEKIKELGSLRQAALSMKMSYRHAWYIINDMNKLAGKPLVILKRGGKNGGIAVITESGEKIISLYNQIKENFNQFLEEQSKFIIF